MKTLLSVLCFFCSLLAYTQMGRLSSPADLSAHNLLLANGSHRVDTLSANNVMGSAYITNDFKLARILLYNGKVADSVPIKFNSYLNEMHIFLKGELMALNNVKEVMYLDDPDDTATLTIFRCGYPKYNYQDSNTFYQVMAGSENIQLLKYIKTSIQTYQIPAAFITAKREFRRDNEWFIYSQKGGLHAVRSSKKSILKALPLQTNRVEAIITKHQLSIRNMEDVIKLIDLLNQE